MKGFVIKFSEEAGVLNLFLSSIIISAISLIATSSAYLQFLISMISFVLLMALFDFLHSKKKYEWFKILQIFLIAVFALFVPNIVPVFTISMGIYLIYFISSANNYLLAFLAHLFDLITTRLALPFFEESNPFMSALMSLIGVNYALLGMKVLLISALLLYSYRNLEGEEEKLFLNGVILLGLSMAIRNALLIFGSF